MNLKLAEVKSTKDYDLFKMINYNRSVMEGRVDKIVESINKYGFILPILVNKNYMIVDGQHRFEAAKKAGSEILYIQFDITDDLLPILISTVNTTSKNWTLDDYLNMWVSLGKEVYVYISDILDNEHIGISIFLRMAGATARASSVYRNGELTFTKAQIARIEKRVTQLNDIRFLSTSYESFINNPAFVNAIVGIIITPEYKHDRMMQVLEASPGSIAKCNTVGDYLEIFSQMYNKGLRNRIRFGK